MSEQPSEWREKWDAAFWNAMGDLYVRRRAPISESDRAKNAEIQRVVNSLLPKGYRFFLLRDLTALVYRRKDGERRCVAQLRLSDNRGPWVAINEINSYMVKVAVATDCGRPSRFRGQGPEFVLSTRTIKELSHSNTEEQ